ncbi:MAG: glycosyltransferase family 2 protein [Candidatus Peregrinibacteria bacterium]|nr:glycosyltransferase family 2 protein [Candidatus Peregrinibacteria bacterium]MCB9807865.1 glycosyltransferase family 2 protein [Candidatus Peribacteria bacterium]
MRIVTITWARNEEDILESFIRHHARMVDKMVIILHCCEDTSYDIALRLQREGITLDIRESNASYHAQGEALTALMHEHADADWIVPLDADEFLCGAQELRSILEQAPTDTVFALPWKTYVPTPADDCNEKDIRRRMCYRRGEEPDQYYKVLVPGALASQSILPLGSHTLLNRFTGAAWPVTRHDALWLAHFPIRSAQQLRRKIVQGWEAHCRNPYRTPEQNIHWKALYERCCDPSPIDTKELQSIAQGYATRKNSVPGLVAECLPLL